MLVNTGRKQDGRFKKGISGNPAGKPRGARNKMTLAAGALLEGEAEALTRKAIELAKGGDTTALRLCMERIVPPRKDRPTFFRSPSISSIRDATNAMAALLEAVANGDVTPCEAGEVGRLLEIYVRAFEAKELEDRIARLEAKK